MRYRVMTTEKANRQLIEIAAYIAEESGDYETAMGVMDKIENTVKRLSETPHRGAIPRTEALKKQGHRVLIVDSYLIFYRCDDALQTVTVTAIIHAKQDYMRVIQ